MRSILFLLLILATPVLAQTDVQKASAPRKVEMNALQRRVLNSETLRSPVFTKQTYRQAKEMDEAVDKQQESYLKTKKEKEQLSEEELKKEQERVETMAYTNYGITDADLKKISPEIEKNPGQSLYNLAASIKVGGYGKTVEEIKNDKAIEAAQLEKQRGLTEEEYQAAVAEGKKNKNPLGDKSISVDLDALK